MATGVVSGTVALMIERARVTYGAAPPVNAIKAMLQVSAFPMKGAANATYHVLAQGAGSLNSAGALALAQAINPAVPAGSYWLATGITKSSTVDGQNIVWGDSTLWGSGSSGTSQSSPDSGTSMLAAPSDSSGSSSPTDAPASVSDTFLLLNMW